MISGYNQNMKYTVNDKYEAFLREISIVQGIDRESVVNYLVGQASQNWHPDDLKRQYPLAIPAKSVGYDFQDWPPFSAINTLFKNYPTIFTLTKFSEPYSKTALNIIAALRRIKAGTLNINVDWNPSWVACLPRGTSVFRQLCEPVDSWDLVFDGIDRASKELQILALQFPQNKHYTGKRNLADFICLNPPGKLGASSLYISMLARIENPEAVAETLEATLQPELKAIAESLLQSIQLRSGISNIERVKYWNGVIDLLKWRGMHPEIVNACSENKIRLQSDLALLEYIFAYQRSGGWIPYQFLRPDGVGWDKFKDWSLRTHQVNLP